MIPDKIKVRVSSFVSDIIDNDGFNFGFIRKHGYPNKNALLNKLIPTLVEVRKYRREQINNILKNEYRREDSEYVYNCVNAVIDSVYFNDEDLSRLDDTIWIRPTKENMASFDEIEQSELKITALELSVYLRSLLNEYARLPQYKREVLLFDKEMNDFSTACESGRIFHFKCMGESHKAFAYNYWYGFIQDQTNYLIMYDIDEQVIKAVPLNMVYDSYVVKQKFKCNNFNKLLKLLEDYTLDCKFEEEIAVEDV